MNKNIRVAIVGGGVSGISAVKECLDEGLEPVCYEQHDQIGGLWYYTEKIRPNQGSALYPSLVTNTTKCMSHFSDFPMPKHYPPYLQHSMMYEYLKSYVAHFRLMDYFCLNTEVVRVKRSSDHEITGNWDITIKTSDSAGVQTTETFARVIIAVGLFKSPYVPDIPGKDAFKGTIIHTNEFRRAEMYQNKRVLIIGNSHSAADAATAISHHAETVYISVGRGMKVVTRVQGTRGTPSDFVSRFTMNLPQWLGVFFLKQQVLKTVDYELYCIETDEDDILKVPICVNDEIVFRLSCGKVLPKTYVKELTSNGAIFQDGSHVDNIDCVIFATGYDVDFGMVEGGILSESYVKRPLEIDLYKLVWPVRSRHNTLAVVGMVMAPAGHYMVFEMQCRWVARVFSGELGLPPKADMQTCMETEKAIMKETFGNRFWVNDVLYRDDIADIIGVKPRFWNQLFTDPVLAFKCFFGPAFPVQYRLCGPHAWSGARQVALNAYEETFSGLKTRLVKKKGKHVVRRAIPFFLLVCTISGAMLAFCI